MDKPDPNRPSLFVSYAREDKDIVAELRKPFMPLEKRFGCKLLWDDSLIRSGEIWLAQIEQAMAQARFAVLLMSPDFVSSSFIQNNELPRLLERSQAGQLTLLPMLVGPIDLSVSGVDQLQFVNPPEKPLGKMNRYEQQDWYQLVAMHVKDALLQEAEAANDHHIGPAAAALAEANKDEPSADVGPAQEAGAVSQRPPAAQWSAVIPPHMAVAEIENQLMRLKQHTRSRGFAVFDCDDYYVQFDYYAELDDQGLVMEAQSNAYLGGGRRLGRMQMRHLTEHLQFSQASPEGNLLLYAPLRTRRDAARLARLSWELLTEVYPSVDGAPLVIQSQCR